MTAPLPVFGLRVLAAFVGVIALVLGVLQALGDHFEFLVPMVPFLVAFGLFKGSLGIEAWLILRSGGAGADALVDQHGNRSGVRIWIGYKFAAMIMALVGAVICYSVLQARG
jgi:hypothetical protein